MPPTSDLLVFAVTALVLIVVPGPSVLFTVGRAMTLGRRGALLPVLGNAGGVYTGQQFQVGFGKHGLDP